MKLFVVSFCWRTLGKLYFATTNLCERDRAAVGRKVARFTPHLVSFTILEEIAL